MRTVAVAIKTFRELVRNPVLPLLSLAIGPFFVLLFAMFFPAGGSTTFPVVVVNQDAGTATDVGPVRLGDRAVAALRQVAGEAGTPILELRTATDLDQARAEIATRRATVFVLIPSGFSRDMAAATKESTTVPMTIGGDLGNPTYPVAAILVADGLNRFAREQTGRPALVELTEIAVGTSASRTEFDLYIPGVLIFAVGLMIFSAAITLAQEIEDGTLNRLVRTPLSAGALLGGITVVQLVLGLASGSASLGAAALLGFRSAGPLWLALPIWGLTSLSMTGLGLLVAAFTRSVAQAFLVANFPFGVFLFLSGTMFPVHGVPLGTINGQEVNLLDVLPPRHAVDALNRLFNYGSAGVDYPLVMLAVLAVIYFALGVWVFRMRLLRVAH